MQAFEPAATAVLLATFGVLLVLAVVFSRVTERIPVPVALVFLLIGMVAGSRSLSLIDFNNFFAAFRIGTIALVLILFDGGMNTAMPALRRVIKPAGVLATFGVIGTALLVGVAGRVAGFSWPEALLIGAIVSSTDAAAVFSVLRGSSLHLKKRVGATLEVESGINDPMAFILTLILTQNLLVPGSLVLWQIPLDIVLQIAVGTATGFAIGRGGRWFISRIRVQAGGLYPAVTLALAFLAFGVPTLLHGSGFLSVYIAGLVLGDGELPYRNSLYRVHDAAAWLSQIVLFMLLGLLVAPQELLEAGWAGVGIALFLTFIARPVVVAFFLLPFKYQPREVAYISWVGLRGAVPIVLATYPVLVLAPGAAQIFLVVFFIVVLSAVLPGATVSWVARKLGLEKLEPPIAPALLAIESRQHLTGDLLHFYVDDDVAVHDVTIEDLALPETAAVTVVVRGNALVPAHPKTTILSGDHVYLIARPEDRGFIQLLFGRPEEE